MYIFLLSLFIFFYLFIFKVQSLGLSNSGIDPLPPHTEQSTCSLDGCRPLRPLDSDLECLPELFLSQSYHIPLCLIIFLAVSHFKRRGFIRRGKRRQKHLFSSSCSTRIEGTKNWYLGSDLHVYFFRVFPLYRAEVFSSSFHGALSMLFFLTFFMDLVSIGCSILNRGFLVTYPCFITF